MTCTYRGEKMAKRTIRIDDDLNEEMNRYDDKNWSAFLRRKLKEEVNYPNAPRIVEKVIDEIEEEENTLAKAWTLHILTYKRARLQETMKELFPEEYEEVTRQIKDRLNEEGLSDLDKDMGRDVDVRGALREGLEDSYLLQDIEDESRNRIEDAADDKKDLVWLLPKYVDDDSSEERIKPHGVAKALSLMNGEEFTPNKVSEMLFELGLAYKSHYSSNQYSYDNHIIPDYALRILDDVEGSPKDFGIYRKGLKSGTVRDHMDSEEFNTFLDWLSEGHGKGYRRVKKYDEEEEIKDVFEGGVEEFNEFCGELIRDGILTIEYTPHRRSRGGNSGASPAKWRYKLTSESMMEIAKEFLSREG
jgi:hypothetical protein